MVQDNYALCRVLICDDRSSAFACRLSDAFAKAFDESNEGQFAGKQQADLLFHFMASGVIGALRNWLNSGCAVDREDVAHIIDHIIMNTYYQLDDFKV